MPSALHILKDVTCLRRYYVTCPSGVNNKNNAKQITQSIQREADNAKHTTRSPKRRTVPKQMILWLVF